MRFIKWLCGWLDSGFRAEMQAAAAIPTASGTISDANGYTFFVPTAPLPDPGPYSDLGVFYFYWAPGASRMHSVQGKVRPGTYRFDPNGTYFFNKKDAGTPVIIQFGDHGTLKSRTVVIPAN